MLAAEPALREHLAAVADLGVTVRWRAGTFYSGWFLAEAPDGFDETWRRALRLVSAALLRG